VDNLWITFAEAHRNPNPKILDYNNK